MTPGAKLKLTDLGVRELAHHFAPPASAVRGTFEGSLQTVESAILVRVDGRQPVYYHPSYWEETTR